MSTARARPKISGARMRRPFPPSPPSPPQSDLHRFDGHATARSGLVSEHLVESLRCVVQPLAILGRRRHRQRQRVGELAAATRVRGSGRASGHRDGRARRDPRRRHWHSPSPPAWPTPRPHTGARRPHLGHGLRQPGGPPPSSHGPCAPGFRGPTRPAPPHMESVWLWSPSLSSSGAAQSRLSTTPMDPVMLSGSATM